MKKIDLTKQHAEYYTAKPQPALIDLPPVSYLSVTGQGDPSSEAFNEKIRALYPVAYAIKFLYKAQGQDFTVPKLEGLWWFDMKKYGGLAMHEAPKKIPRNEWNWRLLIRMPEFVTEKIATQAIENTLHKKNDLHIRKVEWHTLNEGRVVQMLHVGPFDKEPESLIILQEFMRENGLAHAGLHHEIYLSDFRKIAPEKLKTILREPVR
ncbi:MAG: GyrI-like domain-containing protein [Bacteroidota bacterium]